MYKVLLFILSFIFLGVSYSNGRVDIGDIATARHGMLKIKASYLGFESINHSGIEFKQDLINE